MKIGTFVKDRDHSFHGTIGALGVGILSLFFDLQISKEGREYFVIIADPLKEPFEVGVAFPKQKDGKFFHSVIIDSPTLAAPIYATLYPDRIQQNQYNLIWNRPETSLKMPEPSQRSERHGVGNPTPQAAL